MGWQQRKGFNQSAGGKVKGYCLRNVRYGFGIGARYPTATSAWNATQQHRDRNVPGGVDVPLFYSFYTKSGNEGHINVRLANGTVWSDGVIFKSIADFEARQTPNYLGWGETINGTRVIEWVADAAPAPSGGTGKRIQFQGAQTATFYKVSGGTFAMNCANGETWNILENQGYRVRVNSRLAGGDCWVYTIWQSGAQKGRAIAGRSVV